MTRIAGWDTHGLPVEIEVEKELELDGKKAIEEYGVAEFNAHCRESVFKYQSRLAGALEPHRLLARLRPSLRHLQQRVHRVGVVAAEAAARARAARAAGIACCPTARAAAPCSRATSSRSATRTSGQVDLRHVPARGRQRARARRLDDHAVDAARATSPRRWRRISSTASTSGATAARRARSRAPARSCSRTAAGLTARRSHLGDLPCRAVPRWRRLVGYQRARSTSSPLPADGSTARRRARARSSPRRTAPASCTWRPAFGADDYAAGQQHGLATAAPGRGRRNLRRHDVAGDRRASSSPPTRPTS